MNVLFIGKIHLLVIHGVSTLPHLSMPNNSESAVMEADLILHQECGLGRLPADLPQLHHQEPASLSVLAHILKLLLLEVEAQEQEQELEPEQANKDKEEEEEEVVLALNHIECELVRQGVAKLQQVRRKRMVN